MGHMNVLERLATPLQKAAMNALDSDGKDNEDDQNIDSREELQRLFRGITAFRGSFNPAQFRQDLAALDEGNADLYNSLNDRATLLFYDRVINDDRFASIFYENTNTPEERARLKDFIGAEGNETALQEALTQARSGDYRYAESILTTGEKFMAPAPVVSATASFQGAASGQTSVAPVTPAQAQVSPSGTQSQESDADLLASLQPLEDEVAAAQEAVDADDGGILGFLSDFIDEESKLALQAAFESGDFGEIMQAVMDAFQSMDFGGLLESFFNQIGNGPANTSPAPNQPQPAAGMSAGGSS